MSLLIFLSILIPQALAETSQHINTKDSQTSTKKLEVRWEDGLLSVVLNDVAVEEVLKEISRQAGFELTLAGDLKQHIGTSFSRFSLEKGLRVIIDLAGLNSITIFVQEGPSSGQIEPRIKQLIIISSRGDQLGDASDSRPAILASSPSLAIREKPDPESVAQRARLHPTPRPQGPNPAEASPRGIFEGSPEDLDNYLTELVSEERLSPDEYQMIQERIRYSYKKVPRVPR